MHVVILGCGRVGALLAAELGSHHSVTVIDWNPRSFDRLAPDFDGATVVGNGIDVDVLREADVASADTFFALTDADNSNLMAAQVARQLGVGCVAARVYDAERSEVFAEMGIATVSPTIKGADRLFNLVVEEAERQ